MSYKRILLFILLLIASHAAISQQTDNKPAVKEWFMDMGFGMFIHWSMDSQLGGVISHAMAGASGDYLNRYINELPKTFNPKKFDPDSWATLAKLAGMEYVVFTAKHHSGFCMFDTKTTDFNIMHTPFKQDITKRIIDAFRKQGIAIGLYFSPEDFYYFHKNNIPIGRLQDDRHYPVNNRGLMEYDKKQLKELLTNYGKIDLIFFDGPAEGLKEYAWSLNPDIMVTRGQIETPEQDTPDKAFSGPWEACYTMGTDWGYKPTNDPHKSGRQILDMLIEIRAKGGNFLLNIGPKPDGEIQIEQEALLQEISLWNFSNGEAIHDIRPWNVIREGDIWFTRQKKDSNTVYVFIPSQDWKYQERKLFTIRSLAGNADTKVSILGYDSKIAEYKKDFDASIKIENTRFGLMVSAVNGHRFYTDNVWKNPVVLKVTNVQYRNRGSLKEAQQDDMDGAK